MLKKLFILGLIAIASVFVVEKASAISVPESVPENTLELCTDGIDNDLDDASDAADLDCAPFVTPESVPENTLELCIDGIDNDLDDASDAADLDCAPFVTKEDTSNNNGGGSTTSGGGGSTSRAGSIVNVSGGFSTVPTNPTVLGASTGPNGETLICAPYITTFMRMGQANDVEEVKKLQIFLNEFNDAKLPVTGFFGPLTDKAVRDLQTKYANEILKPWVDAGLSPNIQATGYVYKTTVWFINSHKCPEAQTPFPVLN